MIIFEKIVKPIFHRIKNYVQKNHSNQRISHEYHIKIKGKILVYEL